MQIGYFPLCRLLLMPDAHYPWFILVPDREGVGEIHHLSETDRQQLLLESCLLSEAMEQAFEPDKLNIAALGNIVPQLHLHHVARYRHDATWPAPIWGKLPAKAYGGEELDAVINRLKQYLVADITWSL